MRHSASMSKVIDVSDNMVIIGSGTVRPEAINLNNADSLSIGSSHW